MAVSVVYGWGPNPTRPGSRWHIISLLLWGRNFRSGLAGGRGSESHEAAAKTTPGPRHRKACLWPEHPCLNGSLAWSLAGGLGSEPSPGPFVGPLADSRDTVSSSILRVFQLLAEHVL